MPPPSGRAVSHVWSYFTKEPTENPDIFLCTCQICESQRVKPLFSYSFARGKYFLSFLYIHNTFIHYIFIFYKHLFIVFCEYVLGGGTGSFNKHLAKKHGITKETHAASGSGTTSGTGSR